MHKKLVLKRLWGVIEVISQIPPKSFDYQDQSHCVLPNCAPHMGWQLSKNRYLWRGKKRLYYGTLINELVDYHGLNSAAIHALFWAQVVWLKMTPKGEEYRLLIRDMWNGYVNLKLIGTYFRTSTKEGLYSSLKQVQSFFEFIYYLIENDFIVWEQPD